MSPDDLAASRAAGRSASRRELAVARVLDPARSRAETRLQRFLDAAVELLVSAPGKEFTVQEVVERSGQSLRSFYQYFDGKQDLLLALFEDAVRSTAVHLDSATAEVSDPLEKLHVFVLEYHRLCRAGRPGRSARGALAPVLADFAQQLLTQHPQEAGGAFAPLTSCLDGLLAQAETAGLVRPGLRPAVTGVLLQAIMFRAFAGSIGAAALDGDGSSDPRNEGEELWDLFRHGLGVAAAAR